PDRLRPRDTAQRLVDAHSVEIRGGVSVCRAGFAGRGTPVARTSSATRSRPTRPETESRVAFYVAAIHVPAGRVARAENATLLDGRTRRVASARSELAVRSSRALPSARARSTCPC